MLYYTLGSMVYTYIQTKNQSLSVRHPNSTDQTTDQNWSDNYEDQDQDHVDVYFAHFAMLVLFVFFPAIVWILFFCVIHLLLPLYYAYSGNLLVAYSGAPVRPPISPSVKPVEDAMDVEQYGHKGFDRTFTRTTRTCAQSPYIPLLPSSTPLPPSSTPGKGGILGDLEELLEGGGVDLEGGGKGEWEEEEEGELVLHERCVTYYPFMQQLDGGGIGEEGMWRI